MKTSSSTLFGILEFVAVSAGAILYLMHFWPVSVLANVLILLIVVLSSRGLWPEPYNDRRRYASLSQCAAYAALMAHTLRSGRINVISVAFGILFLSSAYRFLREVRERRNATSNTF